MSLCIGAPHPTRSGYYLAGFAWSITNKKTKQKIYPKKGKPFPIWKKA